MYHHGVPILCIIMVELKTGELLHLFKLPKTGTIYIQNRGSWQQAFVHMYTEKILTMLHIHAAEQQQRWSES